MHRHIDDALQTAIADYNALRAEAYPDDPALRAAEAQLRRLGESLDELPAPGRRVQVILSHLQGALGHYGRVARSYLFNGECYVIVRLEDSNPRDLLLPLWCLRDAEDEA